MTVLVTGGAGYIGSHMTLALVDEGERPVVLDNLSTGFKWAISPSADLVEGDVGDSELVAKVIREHNITEVIHFAGSIVVPESVERPLEYYENNTINSYKLVRTCVECGVPRFIFSSTAAVYGMPSRIPVSEDAPLAPISPYGRSKLMTEWMLADTAAAHKDFSYAALRYFNVAGADVKGRAGQSGKKSTHLIKTASKVVVGERQGMKIYGDDYPTPDGTCIRDYIHVNDLADAHLVALRRLREDSESFVVNCGYGRGFSVKEVINAVETVEGASMSVEMAERRAGDPPQLVADSAAIRGQLGWTPRYDDLEYIVRTAIDWERKLAQRNADD